MTCVLIAADSGFSWAGCVLEIRPAQQCGSWWFMPWGLYELKKRCWGKREGVPPRLTFVFSPFPSLQTVPKPIALEPCFGNKAAVLSVFVRLPRGLGGIPPPGQSGLAVASALVDISQQMPIAYKEKSGAIRNRKQQPPAQPGTCI